MQPTEAQSHPTKRVRKHSTAYSQAVLLQKLLLDDAKDPQLKPLIRAGIARAFCELEETKRKLKMRPLPKAVDVEKLRNSKRRAESSGLEV